MTNKDIVANNPKVPPKKIPWFRSGYGWSANWVIGGHDLSFDAQHFSNNEFEEPCWEVRVRAFPLRGPKCCGVAVVIGKTRIAAAQEAMRQAISKAKILQEDAGNPYSISGIRRYE